MTIDDKKLLAQWMCDNEHTLEHGRLVNYYTSGRRADGWKRVAKGGLFRIFVREGKQDIKNPTVTYKDPEDYAVVWVDGKIEWRNLEEARKLGAKIADGVGGYYEPL